MNGGIRQHKFVLSDNTIHSTHILTTPTKSVEMTELPGKTIVSGNTSCILGYLSSSNQQYSCYHNTLINNLLPKPQGQRHTAILSHVQQGEWALIRTCLGSNKILFCQRNQKCKMGVTLS